MCHGRHAITAPPDHHGTPPAEDVFAQDPELRASDREREDAVTRLREHGAAGRLDVDELEERIGSAYAAARAATSRRCCETCPAARARARTAGGASAAAGGTTAGSATAGSPSPRSRRY